MNETLTKDFQALMREHLEHLSPDDKVLVALIVHSLCAKAQHDGARQQWAMMASAAAVRRQQ